MKLKDKSVLIISVGTGTGRDPEGYVNSILYSIKTKNPDAIFFVVSEKTEREVLPRIEEGLDRIGCGAKFVDRIRVSNESDAEGCYEELCEAIYRKILSRGAELDRVSINYTFGTKPMSAALFSAGFTMGILDYNYVAGERRGGTVVSGTERIIAFRAGYVFDLQNVRQAIELFNRYAFVEGLRVLDRVSYPLFEERKKCLKVLFEGFDLWDKFNFLGALAELEKLTDEYVDYLRIWGLKKKVEGAKAYLHRLVSGDFPEELVAEILENAERRYEEGKYDDAMARLYRALEMVGQREFEKVFGCSTSDVDLSRMPESVRKECCNIAKGKIKFGLTRTFRALYGSGSEIGQKYVENEDKFKKILAIRNDSILAHGVTPVGENRYRELRDLLRETFEIKKGIEFFKLDWEKVAFFDMES